MLKFFTLKALGLLTLTLIINSTANAAIVTSVDFEIIDNYSESIAASGKFSGVDNNSDGFLVFEEFSTLVGYSDETGSFDLSHLLDIGDFDIKSGTWLSNARSYRGIDDLWLKYDNGGLSEIDSRFWTVKTSSQSTTVPEPPMLALLGTVFAGLAGFKRKRS